MSVDIRRPSNMAAIDAARWDELVESIKTMFEYELCDACGQDLDGHIIAPDPLGLPHAWCHSEGPS